jgi:hypothetical protein
MSVLDSIIPGYPEVVPIIEDDTLIKFFHVVLFPKQMWRMEAEPLQVPANMGVSQTHTREARIPVDERPRRAGVDPVPKIAGQEQWTSKVRPWNDSTLVNLSVDRTALASTWTKQMRALGINAGETINRLPRNTLFRDYGTGHTLANTATAATTFEVASIAGFTHQITTVGDIETISVSNPKRFYIDGVLQTPRLIGAVPNDAEYPLGPGTLTTSANVTVALNSIIRAYDAPMIVRAGGGASVDAILPNNVLRLQDINRGAAMMADNGIPTHADGLYHVHLPATVNSSLFNDSQVQQLTEGQWGDAPYRAQMIGIILNCLFITNSEVPRSNNCQGLMQSRPDSAPLAMCAPYIGIELVNRLGVPIMRCIITGGEALVECYTNAFPGQEAPAGFAGSMGSFAPISNGMIQANTAGIKVIVRAPQDAQGQIVTLTWAWGGDYCCPSDASGGQTNARFKRCVVVECADMTYVNA